MSEPLAIDLFCGLGGWTEGLLAEGYYVVGFDNHQHVYGEFRYPGQLVLQDVRTLHGSQFKDAALIVGSSPCQEFSWRAMPWKKAKAAPPPYLGMELFEAQFRIQREASEAAGHHIPMVVENVRGAQPWVGRSRWNYGSFHLWGDVPALMPMVRNHAKVGGLDWSKFGRPDYKTSGAAGCFRDSAIKNTGGSWFAIAHNKGSGVGRNPDGRNDPRDDVKTGGDWFSGDSFMTRGSHKSSKRKMASALIAKIPLPVARHIARTYFPSAKGVSDV